MNPKNVQNKQQTYIDGDRPGPEPDGNARDSARGSDRNSTTPNEQVPPRDTEPLELPTDKTLPLREEKLKIGKREVAAGGVRIRKVVRTETINQPVELRREEFVVEHVPPGEISCTGGEMTNPIGEEDIFVPLRREEVVIEKEMHVREAIRIGRKSETEKKTINEEVRKEEVEIERGPDEQRS